MYSFLFLSEHLSKLIYQQEFQLIEKKELAPLQELIDRLTTNNATERSSAASEH